MCRVYVKIEHKRLQAVCSECAVNCRKNENKEIAVLNVSHDGISNAELWEQWIKLFENSNNKVYYYCLSNNSVTNGQHFIDQHRISLEKENGWGTFSTVIWRIVGIQNILKCHPHISHIVLTSGNDVPVISPQTLR